MANLRGQAGGARVAQAAFRVRPTNAATLDAAETLEVDMFDFIGEGWDGDGVSAKMVLEQLRGAKKAQTINVRMNSAGGDAWDGIAIYNLLHQNSARVIVEVDGVAASAASIIAMAGDEIRMAENSLMMIHNPWSIAVGEAKDMRARADELDKLRDAGVATYMARTGRSREDVVAMMDAETWMTADEAFALGFATHVTPAKQAAAMLRSDIDLSRFKTPAPRACDYTVKLDSSKLVADIRKAAQDPTAPQDTPPAPPEPAKQTKDEDTMSNLHPSIAQALGLPVGAPESDCIAACARLRELEVQVVALTGCASSSEAAGAVRGLKAAADESDKLRKENAQLRGERDKQNFETQLQRGLSERKLSPKTAELYREKFERASAESRGAEVVADLKGFVDVAPTLHQEVLRQPAASGSGSGAPLAWNGKSYAEMKPMERARLARENPELWKLMKADWEAPAA